MQQYQFRLGLLGLVVFIIVMLAQLPASWVLSWIEAGTSQRLLWQHASGSVFDARVGALTVDVAPDRRIVLEQIELDTSILPLLVGRLIFEFKGRVNNEEFSGRANLGWGKWRLHQVQGRISLEALASLLPELEIFGVRGDVLFRGDSLVGRYNQLPDTGSVDAMIDGLYLGLIQTREPLGSYTIKLHDNDAGQMSGALLTVGDDALLNFEVNINLSAENRNVAIQGQAWAGNNEAEAVQAMLPLMGPVQGNRARINWQRNF